MNLFFLSWRLGKNWNLKPKFKFQLFPSRQDRETNSSVLFLGEVASRQFCFNIYWPLIDLVLNHRSKKSQGLIIISVFKIIQLCWNLSLPFLFWKWFKVKNRHLNTFEQFQLLIFLTHKMFFSLVDISRPLCACTEIWDNTNLYFNVTRKNIYNLSTRQTWYTDEASILLSSDPLRIFNNGQFAVITNMWWG